MVLVASGVNDATLIVHPLPGGVVRPTGIGLVQCDPARAGGVGDDADHRFSCSVSRGFLLCVVHADVGTP